MIGCVDLRQITTDLLIEVQSAVRAVSFHKAKEYRSVVLQLCRGLSAVLDDYERPLRYSSKEFRQVGMRNDFWFRDALMRQRRNDRAIYFIS